MKKRKRKCKTLKNKVYAVALMGIGTVSVPVENDATFLLLSLVVGLSLFFAKVQVVD